MEHGICWDIGPHPASPLTRPEGVWASGVSRQVGPVAVGAKRVSRSSSLLGRFSLRQLLQQPQAARLGCPLNCGAEPARGRCTHQPATALGGAWCR